MLFYLRSVFASGGRKADLMCFCILKLNWQTLCMNIFWSKLLNCDKFLLLPVGFYCEQINYLFVVFT